MKIGTKSYLFGVHCFFIHPIVVALAWRKYYGVWPHKLSHWLAILLHDVGYVGSANMDGLEGIRHPERSAQFIVRWLPRLGFSCVTTLETVFMVSRHSKSYCKLRSACTSALYEPDKLSVVFEPTWFYVLRARLSGEIYEYMKNDGGCSDPSCWLRSYKERVSANFINQNAQAKLRQQRQAAL